MRADLGIQHFLLVLQPLWQVLSPRSGDWFQTDEVERLQLELAQARAALGEYPEKFFDQRSANLRLRNYINWLRTIIRNRADSINEMSETLKRLRGVPAAGKDLQNPGNQ